MNRTTESQAHPETGPEPVVGLLPVKEDFSPLPHISCVCNTADAINAPRAVIVRGESLPDLEKKPTGAFSREPTRANIWGLELLSLGAGPRSVGLRPYSCFSLGIYCPAAKPDRGCQKQQE